MLEVVCWKWKVNGYRSVFGPETVNVLRNMVARHLHLPHRFSCITDDAHGIDSNVRIIPLWDTFADIPNPSNPRNPSCYRRLPMFSEEAREIIGERIFSLDLDAVITGDITPLVDHDHDFVIWGGQSVQPGVRGGRVYSWYNGSLMYLRAGARTRVWTEFDPKVSPMKAHLSNARGSDQGWITYILGHKERIWNDQDGVYSYRNHIAPARNKLPVNARFVAFHGRHDPWMPEVQRANPWIREHYH
jgi:hypothetical protein